MLEEEKEPEEPVVVKRRGRKPVADVRNRKGLASVSKTRAGSATARRNKYGDGGVGLKKKMKPSAKEKHEAWMAKHQANNVNPEELNKIPAAGRNPKVSPRKQARPDRSHDEVFEQFTSPQNICKLTGKPLVIG
jgi:hypothetical protein